MYRALVQHYPGIGWDEFGELTLGKYGGLLGLDIIDAASDPDMGRAHSELAAKRGPSPDRKG